MQSCNTPHRAPATAGAEHRLVKGSISPTKIIRCDNCRQVSIWLDADEGSAICQHCGDSLSFKPAMWRSSRAGPVASPPQPQPMGIEKLPDMTLRVERRDWSDEYRLRIQADVTPNKPPLAPARRVTKRLTPRGAAQISNSCAYLCSQGEGYKTFLTLTFSDANRARLAAGEITIQRETSRFFDSLTKWAARGWRPRYARGKQQTEDGAPFVPLTWRTEKQPGFDLKYCWIAENPLNEKGERNPHMHVLLNWTVPWELFPAWAARAEKRIWKQGFAHLERLRHSESAGFYMAKAAKYLSKAADGDDQGEVRGNRYGLCAPARAPGWEHIAVYAAAGMAELFSIARARYRARMRPLAASRDAIKAELRATPRRNRRRRSTLGRLLAAQRHKIDGLGGYVGRWHVVLRGRKMLWKWWTWVQSHGWRPENRPPTLWLVELRHRLQDARDRARTWRPADHDWWQAIRKLAI